MKHKMKRNKNNSLGFTVIEVAMVIAIIGVLAAVSLPGILKNLPEKRLRSAARDMYGTMQKARLLAVKENRNISIRFNASGYFIDSDNDNAASPGEFSISLADKYGDVAFGWGSAAADSCDWNTGNTCLQENPITFTKTGILDPDITPPADRFFESQAMGGVFAVSASIYGSVKIRQLNGANWE